MDFGHEVLTQSFTMPEVTLGGEGGLMSQNIAVKFSIGDTYTRFPANVIAGILASEGSDRIYCSTSEILNPGENGVDEKISFEFDKELPESVLSIRSLDMDGDVSRTNRQRKVINALIEKFRGTKLTTLLGLLDDLLPMVTTDMSNKEMISLATELFPMLADCTIVSQRIPADNTYTQRSIDGMSCIVADMDAARKLLEETIGG